MRGARPSHFPIDEVQLVDDALLRIVIINNKKQHINKQQQQKKTTREVALVVVATFSSITSPNPIISSINFINNNNTKM